MSIRQHRSLSQAIDRGSSAEAEQLIREHLEKDLTPFNEDATKE
jgi:DNA-binding FadR family transcriptional regulator